MFVLSEVFEMPYGEIAEAIGKPAGTVRPRPPIGATVSALAVEPNPPGVFIRGDSVTARR